MTLLCDADLHFHDVSRLPTLAFGESIGAPCPCGGASVRAAHTKDGWQVLAPDDTVVWSASDLVALGGSQLHVGVARALSEV